MTIRRGWIFGIATYFLMGINPPLSKWLLDNGMNPSSLLTFRFFIGALIFFVAFAVSNLAQPKEGEKPLDKRGFWFAVLAGSLNGINLITYFTSFLYLSASVASVLSGGIYLVSTLFLLPFLGEKLTGLKLIRLGLGLAGIYFLINPAGDSSADGWGVFYITIAALTYTFQMIVVQYFLQGYNMWRIAQILVVSATILPFGYWLFLGAQNGELATYVPGIQGWVFLLILSFFSTFIARWTQFSAVTSIGSGEMALLSPLGTAVILIGAFLLLGEWLTPAEWLGTLFVIIGVALAGFAPSPKLATSRKSHA